MSNEYGQGYLEALDVLDKHINEEMKRNGDELTPTMLLNVFNSIIAKLHVETSKTKEYLRETTYVDPQKEEAEFAELMADLFGANVQLVDLREFIIQGGTKL